MILQPVTSICAGYISGDQLFEIGGLTGARGSVPVFVANTFSILTRGAPTHPSPRLQTDLDIEWKNFKTSELRLLPKQVPQWDETILGGEDGYNPALEFFAALPEIIGAWGFIAKLLVPEYPLFKRLGASEKLFDGGNSERVDFYLPQADLVIEIDGEQHLQKAQMWKDNERDRFLERLGIVTLRLSTRAFRLRGEEFEDFVSTLIDRLDNAPRLQPYREFEEGALWDRPNLCFDLTASLRLQLAVIMAIAHDMLDLTAPIWTLNIEQDFQSSSNRDWVRACFDDLFDWFGLFARLKNCEFKPPHIILNETGLSFDLRLFSRADDRTWREDAVTIRTSSVQDHPFIIDMGRPPKTTRLIYYGLSQLVPTFSSRLSERLPNLSDVAELARRVFGHEALRPGQDTLVINALSGQKSLGLMPTGGGKSLCFQLPALLGHGTIIVVVPIKALGRDHKAELDAAGFRERVVTIDSDTPSPLREKAYRWRMLRGDFRFVFVSPERFQTASFRDLVSQLVSSSSLQMIVIDEVHCMSEWGHDFRPSYLTLPGTLREVAPDVVILGLTATASVNVLKDIQSEFEISDEMVAYEMHRTRSELNFSIRKGLAGPNQIANEVVKIIGEDVEDDPPPIHVFSRYANGGGGVLGLSVEIAQADSTLRIGFFSGSSPKDYKGNTAYELLRNEQVTPPADYQAYKQRVQELWKRSELDVIVTTKAFGMGVNKPNVRHTLHAGMPGSMEAFYQEAGRAGRDRNAAHCHMILNPEADDVESVFLKLKESLKPEAIDEAINSRSRADRGDFRAQLWFLRQGIVSVEQERALVLRLHRLISEEQNDRMVVRATQLEEDQSGGLRFQLTLYRLYQMGLIKPWIVTDWGRADQDEPSVQAVEVERVGIDFAKACANVISRIKAIDGAGAESLAIEKLRDLERGAEDWPALYDVLLEWVRRTQLGSRLQSAWNLYSASMSFTPEKADEFRDELEAFFKVDSSAFQLAALRDMAFDEVVNTVNTLIMSADGTRLLDKGGLRKLSAQLARLLEGTQESRGLNFAAGCLYLLTDPDATHEAMTRFHAAVPEGALSIWAGCGRSILSRVASSSETAREAIGAWLLESGPERLQLMNIYRDVESDVVAAALFRHIAAELEVVV